MAGDDDDLLSSGQQLPLLQLGSPPSPPDIALAGLLAGCLEMVVMIVTTVVDVKVTLSAGSFLLLPVSPSCWRRPRILLLCPDISLLLMLMMGEMYSSLSLCSLSPESTLSVRTLSRSCPP